MYTISKNPQGTDEWMQDRLGKLTASVFDKVITPTGKPSSQKEELINRLVAELVMQVPDETFQSESMLRGKLLEDEAIEYFNFTYDLNFTKCGFMDSGKGYGCSPDGLDEALRVGLELKCPEAHTHLAYLTSSGLPNKYKMQVQGALLVSGFDKWIFGSYHPDFPCFKVEVERDEEILKPLEKLLLECADEVQKKLIMIKEKVEAA